MDATVELDALSTAARALAGRWGTVSDEQLLADGAAWEALGRIVDAVSRGGTAATVRRGIPARRIAHAVSGMVMISPMR